MRQIWKYRLDVADSQVIHMPKGAEPLTVMVQNGEPHLWMMVTSAYPYVSRIIAVVPTGYNHDYHDYIGSFQLQENGFVGHVFDLGEV